ncbi:PhzF family phenazine biosynthesis protein [Actinomadura oligospora]|uniref:PhzF family phenazine biosynthesis protein n=1 Tax=Actinomadura oligospora TaxID=111804 RepID=UPI000479C6F6|nr:PhzF family phenazine biosynthesis protein [Actinomadura oligospora]
MVEIPLYQVDAFTDRVMRGNPAAVCPLPSWLPDGLMQAIAWENNLPETAFIVGGDGRYDLRWFTPATEVDLCGHATLAAAYVVLTHLEEGRNEVVFRSAGGPLAVTRSGDLLSLTFPALPYDKAVPPENLLRGLGPVPPAEVYRSMDYIAVYETEQQLRAIVPDQRLLGTLDLRGVVVTAPADDTTPWDLTAAGADSASGDVTMPGAGTGPAAGIDFCSRFFGPKLAIPEDPITGSAHCALVPYWAGRLDRTRLRARQLSPRLGETQAIDLDCALVGDRVRMSGGARQYLAGTIRLTPDDLRHHDRSN